MNAAELAAKLNGRQYREEITAEEAVAANLAGLVVLFGASDDLAEFRGAINDEIRAGGMGNPIALLDGALLDDEGCDCRWARAYRESAMSRLREITPHWCDGSGYSWTYETDIPHATFDVMEGDEKYCRGIVFSLVNAK